jgi:putative membrane protein
MIVAPLLAGTVAAIYLRAAWSVRWRWRRTASFVAGTAVLAAAPLTPSGTLAGHMVEHSLIIGVAAPLLVLGAPVALLMRVLPPRARDVGVAVLRSRAARLLAHPAVTWSLFVGVQWAFHLTPLIEASETRPVLHAFEHVAFLGAGILFWLPVLGSNPVPRRLGGAERTLYLFFAVPAVDIAGAALMARGDEAAGVAMLAGSLPVILGAIALTWQWLVREDRRAAVLEGVHGAAG